MLEDDRKNLGVLDTAIVQYGVQSEQFLGCPDATELVFSKSSNIHCERDELMLEIL